MVDYITIAVPDMNDSMSRITLQGVSYQIRFTYNDTGDYWKFGLYTAAGEPIVIGMKIVPRFPLNLFQNLTRLPFGVFGVYTKLDRIGRNDFKNGKATFAFIPATRPEV